MAYRAQLLLYMTSCMSGMIPWSGTMGRGADLLAPGGLKDIFRQLSPSIRNIHIYSGNYRQQNQQQRKGRMDHHILTNSLHIGPVPAGVTLGTDVVADLTLV